MQDAPGSQGAPGEAGFYEMLWDCDHCGTKGLLGKSQRHCPECGAKQNPDKRYFPAPGAAQKVDGHLYEGSDRTCPNCSAAMGAKAKACANCGATLDGAKEVKEVMAVASAMVGAAPNRAWIKVVVILGVIALIGFGIWYRFIRTHVATMTIASHEWSRSIGVDEFKDVEQQAWQDEVPAGSRLPFCSQKERSKKRVPDGEDCHMERHDRKDGTFENVRKCKAKFQSVSVMGSWCKFHVNRWTEVDRVAQQGVGLAAAWPAANLPAPTAVDLLGQRKQGARKEVYTLIVGTDRCDVSEATWKKYVDGQKAKVEVRASSGNVVCSSL